MLLKNIASGGKSRLLPLDKHAKEHIVVAGPMVRLAHDACCTLKGADVQIQRHEVFGLLYTFVITAGAISAVQPSNAGTHD